MFNIDLNVLYTIAPILLVTISCSLLGVFVLWKRSTYFADCFSHASLLAVIISTYLGSGVINSGLPEKSWLAVSSIFLFAVFFGSVIALFGERMKIFSKNAVIAIFSYGLLALAVILAQSRSILDRVGEIELEPLLFGGKEIAQQDIVLILILTCITILYSTLFFRRILFLDVSRELAKIEGVRVAPLDISFFCLLAVVISFSLPIAGAFLVTALLVLPAAIARLVSGSASLMLLVSVSIGVICSIMSVIVSQSASTPLSPTLVLILISIFITLVIFRR